MVQFVVGRHDRGTLRQWLTQEGLPAACDAAQLWLRDLPPTTTVVDAVERCPQGSWLLWGAARLDIDRETLCPVRDAMIRRGVVKYLFPLIVKADVLSTETDPRRWVDSMDATELTALSRRIYTAATKQRARLEQLLWEGDPTPTFQQQARVVRRVQQIALDLARVLTVELYTVAEAVTMWAVDIFGDAPGGEDPRESARAESAQIANETRELLRHHPVWVNAIRDFGVIGTGYCDR